MSDLSSSVTVDRTIGTFEIDVNYTIDGYYDPETGEYFGDTNWYAILTAPDGSSGWGGSGSGSESNTAQIVQGLPGGNTPVTYRIDFYAQNTFSVQTISEHFNVFAAAFATTDQAFAGTSLIDIAIAGSGNDTLAGLAGDDFLDGGDGDDTLDGGQGNDRLTGGAGTNTMTGGIGDDTYFVGSLTDVIAEQFNEGFDTVYATVTTTLSPNVEQLVLLDEGYFIDGTGNAGDNTIIGNSLSNVLFGLDGNDDLHGGNGDDTLDAGAGNDLLDGGGGADDMTGGTGDDLYYVDSVDDTIHEAAGEGNDTAQVAFIGSYALADEVENLTKLFDGAFVGTGNGLSNRMTGGTGNDTLSGLAGDDVLHGGEGQDLLLSGTGDDALHGDAGNDGLFFGADFDLSDSADGGDGFDQLGLQGNYAGGLTFGANSLVDVEQLVLLAGNDTRFGDVAGNLYSYNLATVDANVAAGQKLIVSFNTLRAGENVTFDGSAETDGSFITYAGSGNDALVGGQQSDGFFFGHGMWGASDSVDGQGGSLDQLGLQGDYSGGGAIVFGAGQLTNVEMIVCVTSGDTRFGAQAGAGYSYDLTMNDGNVAAGQTLYVSANTLRAADGSVLLVDETLAFDGSAETNGKFVIYSGFGADHITGGAGDDTIYGGGGADQMSGGAGNDLFAYISAGHSTAAAMDQILDFASGDRIDLSRIDAVDGGSHDGFTFVGSTAFSHTAGELRAFEQSTGHWQVEGDVDGDGTADLVIAVATDHALSGADFAL